MNKFVSKYGQILLPLISPFDANENIDCGVYTQLIEYLEANDLCDSFIVTGTTGEASLLTFDERVQLMEACCALVAAACRRQGLCETRADFLDFHAREIMEHIQDPALRTLPLLR